MADHKLPGEFVYDGCHFDSLVTSPKMMDGIRHLNLASEDTIVAAYIKSGTTWMRLIVYFIQHEGELFKTSNTMASMGKRQLEFRTQGESEEDNLLAVQQTPPPRMFSSHAHFRFIDNLVLENKVKVIVVMRNPKDTLVSLFHFYRMAAPMGYFTGTWEEFFELFKAKRLWGGDFFDYNTAWWNNRDKENVFITSYEEMKRDREGVVRKVAKFLGKDLSDEVVGKIVDQTSFEKMRDNPSVNMEDIAKTGVLDFSKGKFLRKGEVGDWKNLFSNEQVEYVNQLCDKICKPIGLQFEDCL